MVARNPKQTFDAIFENGVLRPREPISLRENERVRVTIESIVWPSDESKAAAAKRMEDRVKEMNFRSDGSYPSREGLHDRDV